MSWISNFYEDEQYYASAANYFQSIGPTNEKKNGDSRSERSTEYYDLHLTLANTKEFEIPFMRCSQIQCNVTTATDNYLCT